MRKILFLGSGSANDPGFEGVEINGQPFGSYMNEKGITVLDRVVESCHGCPDLLANYSRQMQSLVDAGDKVVACLQGGLYFALPSIQATQTTYPIISCPTDNVAFQGIMVPSGHAVIAGVGVERDGETTQREKALTLAARILTLENDKVNIIGDQSGKLLDELAKYEIGGNLTQEPGLALAYTTDLRQVHPPKNTLLIKANPDEDVNNWDYLMLGELRHHAPEFNRVPTAEVRGSKNLALFAAKILSLQRPDIREKIKAIETKKRSSYEERDLLKELKQMEEN